MTLSRLSAIRRQESRRKMNVSRELLYLFAIVILCFPCGAAYCQSTTATLSGTVHDPTGAVVQGAKITLMNPTKGTSRTTPTNAEAPYLLSTLQPPSYVIRPQH